MSRINAHFQVDHGDFNLDIKLSLPGQGVSALFGPSGSGKTSCLRAMAGLEKLPNSYFSIADEVWQDSEKDIFVPPYQREIGYVFQEASLFKHLNVRDNLNFGRQRIAPNKRNVDIDHICDILSLNALLDRPPASLSGGERQRVAIARALLTSPKLLLMDEPLSALDHSLKSEILPYLENLQQALSIPMIYVSHSPDEVARLADHIAIIDKGRLLKSGALAQVMLDAEVGTRFYDGRSSMLFAKVNAHQPEDYLTELAIDNLRLSVPQIDKPVNSKLRCRINAKDVSLCLTPAQYSSIGNVLAGIVINIEASDTLGERIICIKISAHQTLLAQITYASTKRLNLRQGSPIWAQIKSVVIL
ncbi:molybdenum import ATP-binding protein ModC [Psychromonas marina]|uniref:Molybdenum import ATP-binding protein ModC n=1 Tax=Psychromonas marina TaxID=88364 RepID=A0ABQ6E5K4_9GAMM|nr:molybdenum ABC transporter ATP-binding protein [Psychromonas marina]GLS92529.1 molybdenum import ATP-binding protein ModC [Psychromonas marina]